MARSTIFMAEQNIHLSVLTHFKNLLKNILFIFDQEGLDWEELGQG